MTRAALCFVSALLAALTTSCLGSQAPLRIGTNAWPGYEFLHLANHLGLFEKHGASVRLVEFGSLSDAQRAFEHGYIDGFATTVYDVLQSAHNVPREPSVVIVADYSDGADVVLGRPGARLADLKGAKVGVEQGTVNMLLLLMALNDAGLDRHDVQLVMMSALDMLEAFQDGRIDAFVSYPPHSLMASREGATTLFTSAQIPQQVLDVVVVDAVVAQRRERDVRGMVTAFFDAMEHATAHEAEDFAFMAEREGVTTAEFAATLKSGIRLVPRGEQAAYLADGGRLKTVVERTESLMVAANQVSQPLRGQVLLPRLPWLVARR